MTIVTIVECKNTSTMTTIMGRMATAGDLVRPAFGRYSLPLQQLATVSLHQKSVASVVSVASGDNGPSLFQELTTLATPLTTVVTDATVLGHSESVASCRNGHTTCRVCHTPLYTSTGNGRCQSCRKKDPDDEIPF